MRTYLIYPLIALLLTSCTAQRSAVPSETSGANTFASRLPQTNQKTFRHDVLEANKPVLVDFYAPWCSYCKLAEPQVESFAQQYNGKIRVLQVDVTKNPELAQQYRVNAIPHFILFKDGDIVDELMGVPSKQQLSSAVRQTL